MATTLQPPPTIKLPGSGNARRLVARESTASSTGIWVALAAITMTFAAFTSAMIVRQGSGNDWRHFAFPIILYWNTAVLGASSVTLQMARRRFAFASADLGEHSASVLRALYGTLVLGCTFVIGQYAAWHQLRAERLYLASAASSSFFYVFTVLHALHVIGGLIGLGYVISKLHFCILRLNTLKSAFYYCYFMEVV